MFVCRHYLFQDKAVLQERSLRKPLSFEEQILSKDKYTRMLLHKIEAINCVYYPSNILQPAKLLGPRGLVYLILSTFRIVSVALINLL